MNITELPEEMLMEIFMYTSLPTWASVCKIFSSLVSKYKQRMNNHLCDRYEFILDNVVDDDNVGSCIFILKYGRGFTIMRRDTILSRCIMHQRWSMARVLALYHSASISGTFHRQLGILETYVIDGDIDILGLNRSSRVTFVVYTTSRVYTYYTKRMYVDLDDIPPMMKYMGNYISINDHDIPNHMYFNFTYSSMIGVNIHRNIPTLTSIMQRILAKETSASIHHIDIHTTK